MQAFARIGQAALECRFGNAQALQSNLEARIVHHREHAGQALIRLTDQPTRGAVEIHHTGGGTLDAHLVLQRPAAQGIARSGRSIGVEQPLGYQEQADPFDTRRCIRQSSEHQVNDVVAQILFAAADEDLAAAELVAAIHLGLGAGAQQCQV
ncbi:hypothetical protein D3C76_1032460 [compost metagenome]